MKRLILFIFTLSSAAFFSPQARATSTAPVNGDLLMGFEATSGAGSSQDYLLDLGQATNFENLSPGSSIVLLSSSTSAIGNIGADLTTLFGADWIHDPNLYWGVAAVATTSDPSHFLYVSTAELTPGTIQAGPAAGSNSAQGGTPTTQIEGCENGAIPATQSGTNSSVAFIQNDTATGSWDSYNPEPGNAFGYFNGGISGTFDNASTAGETPLDLYQLVPGSSLTKQTNYLGSFTIDPAGDLTFTNETAVPEPATYGLLAWGAGALFIVARKKMKRSSAS